MGVAALAELTLAATEWKNAYWAKEKGLYAKVFETITEADNEIETLTNKLAAYNPEALSTLKKALWENTNHWDLLLIDRAKTSGKLVLSNFTKKALEKFKK